MKLLLFASPPMGQPPLPPGLDPCFPQTCVDIDQGIPYLIIAFLIYLIYRELKVNSKK